VFRHFLLWPPRQFHPIASSAFLQSFFASKPPSLYFSSLSFC
jgi:hypothetical protein